MTASTKMLPPGQHTLTHFPRFGLSQFADRMPSPETHVAIELGGDAISSGQIDADDLIGLSRVDQRADFHCVTTWSVCNLHWCGYRFREFYEAVLCPRLRPNTDAQYLVFRGRDGYGAILLLEDALQADVLLADTLNGEPLSAEHGAPLRLVAPQQYGYKNPKYLCGIELWHDADHFHVPTPRRFMHHLRARVAHEERGNGLPGWLLRYLYRPLIQPTIHQYARYAVRNDN